jgi:hypothetical protein
MKRLIVMLFVCAFLAGVSLTATVGCGGEAKKTEVKKTDEPKKDGEKKAEGEMPK